MYATMSFSEYVTHRYYQHTDYNKNAVMQFFANLFTNNKGHKIRGGGHVEHHAETLDDMSLRNDARWVKSPAAVFLNADKYRGTAFSWWAGTTPWVLSLIILGLPTTYLSPSPPPLYRSCPLSNRNQNSVHDVSSNVCDVHPFHDGHRVVTAVNGRVDHPFPAHTHPGLERPSSCHARSS